MLDLARWLDAKYYESRYRPIPIQDYLVYDNDIYPAADPSAFLAKGQPPDGIASAGRPPKPCRKIDPGKHPALRSPVVNAVVALSIETIKAGYGALVFCGSRKGCEATATLISEAAPKEDELSRDIREARLEILNDLRSSAVGLEPTLEKTIMAGVAFHRE